MLREILECQQSLAPRYAYDRRYTLFDKHNAGRFFLFLFSILFSFLFIASSFPYRFVTSQISGRVIFNGTRPMPPAAAADCDSILGSSDLIVMPHLVGRGSAPSPGARIGTGVQFWMIGTTVVACDTAAWWRTSCGNQAIACLERRSTMKRDIRIQSNGD